ncbi:hypothetical protein [Microbulbifer epialgicus]|uniref:Uncharacterized protein n=1 Tax=Microbulbifer epialgicus TaxID=393907 RepID=A0ABV4NYD4_9GAMM
MTDWFYLNGGNYFNNNFLFVDVLVGERIICIDSQLAVWAGLILEFTELLFWLRVRNIDSLNGWVFHYLRVLGPL